MLAGKPVCADCGRPLKLRTNDKVFICSTYNNHGKKYCTSHSIRESLLEELVKQDLKAIAKDISLSEEQARNHFLTEHSRKTQKSCKDKEKICKVSKNRLLELDMLIQSVYEDKVLKAMPEEVCTNLMQGYILEKETLTENISKLKEELAQADQDEALADGYIKALKKYAKCENLTREMVLQLIERIEVGEDSKDGTPRNIRIYYKFQNADN